MLTRLITGKNSFLLCSFITKVTLRINTITESGPLEYLSQLNIKKSIEYNQLLYSIINKYNKNLT